MNSVVHFTIGHNPKPSPTPAFPGTDGEKRTQRHARLHGNTANKTARISRRRRQAQRPSYIYLFHSKVALQLVRSQGTKYLQKAQSQIQEIFMKE